MRGKDVSLEIFGSAKQPDITSFDRKEIFVVHVGRNAFLVPVFFGVVAVHLTTRPKTVNGDRQWERQRNNTDPGESRQRPGAFLPNPTEGNQDNRQKSHETVLSENRQTQCQSEQSGIPSGRSFVGRKVIEKEK